MEEGKNINWGFVAVIIVVVALGCLFLTSGPQNHQPSIAIADPNNTTADIDFMCPEAYPSGEDMNNGTKKFTEEYIKKFPGATLTDLLKYRYQMLVKENCQKTLDYIKAQANGEDPITSYVEKTLQEYGQDNSSH